MCFDLSQFENAKCLITNYLSTINYVGFASISHTKVTDLETHLTHQLIKAATINIVPNKVGYYTIKNSYVSATTFSCTDFIKVETGDIIIYSGWSGSDSVGNINAFDENKTFVTPLSIGNGSSTNKAKLNEITTIPDNIGYVKISVANDSHPKYSEISIVLIKSQNFVNDVSDTINDTKQLSDTVSTLYDNVNQINRYLNSENTNFLPENMRIDANTDISGISSTSSKPWYPFRSTCQLIDDYWEITCTDLTTYAGIRSDNIYNFLPIDITKEIYVDFEIYIESSDALNYALFFDTVPTTTTGPVYFKINEKNVWKNIHLTITLNKIEYYPFKRFQIGNTDISPNGIVYRIKNLSIYQEQENIYSILNEQTDNKINTTKNEILSILSKDFSGKYISVIGDSISTINENNTPYWTVQNVDVSQQIQSYVTWWDVWSDTNGTNQTNKTIGGVSLTPQMIGTLQTFTPVSSDVGKTIGTAYNYNSSSTKVWSEQLCEMLGCSLLGNASWSGS